MQYFFLKKDVIVSAMRILLLSPLYPPDIAESAHYVKELARRLSGDYEISVLTYGHLPEKVAGVKIRAIDKRRSLPLRLLLYTAVLLRKSSRADVIFAGNGPSVEFPLLVASFFTKAKILLHVGDRAAHDYASRHFLRRWIERAAFSLGEKIIEEIPLPRPEINPLKPYPDTAFKEYERSWEKHEEMLHRLFRHAS